jgi:hypothetical protein
MTPRTAQPPTRAPLVRRFGPLTAVLVAIGLVAALASTGRDDAGSTVKASVAGSSKSQLPVTWDEALKSEKGTGRYDWGDECDPKTGRVTVPSVYAPPCVVKRPGTKGGATSQGVTEDSIKIVQYVPADDDLAASLQSTLDPEEKQKETRTALIRMLEDRYEMWGRKLDLVFVKGTGSDETSARADAVKVATEIKAFASVGGPAQQSAYSEELSSRGVLCLGCGLSVPDSTFQKNAPFMWGNLQTPEQYLLNLGDYLVGRLLDKPAKFAGDPEMRTKDRVFGVVHFEQDPPVFGGVEDIVEERGKATGYKAAVNLTYQLVIAQLGEKARTLVARLKEKKVTTVVFLGDPIMPMYLTKAATAQGYFPEWVITGTVLTDTTVFGRQYDQEQWAHAFGISSLPARVPQDRGEAWRLHEWFYGKPPAAQKTAAILLEPIRILMLGLHLAGPHLTPETFRDGLFGYPPSGGSPTQPQQSFGEHGIFAQPDYLAVDDMVEIWWDADATGADEQGKEGAGMMRYANGGRRYLPGEMPNTDPDAFVEAGSVMGYDETPAADAPPDYPSPAKGGG